MKENKRVYNPVQKAYDLLCSLLNDKETPLTVERAAEYVQDAIGYLGEALG